MSGLSRNVMLAGMLAGMMAALATPAGADRHIEISRKRDATPALSFDRFHGPRGKGRNKSPRRRTGVAAAKRAAIKARNRRKS
jgi:hypothetical protein